MTREELFAKALQCNRCGTCRGVIQETVPNPAFTSQCPPGMTMFGAYEPAGLMYIARGIAQGELEWDEDTANILYACTLCGYCEDLCMRGYRHTPAIAILEELRRIIPEKLRPKSIQKAAEFINVLSNHKLSKLRTYDVPDMSQGGKANTILFPDRSILTNENKLKEIGSIIQKSGKKIGCFIAKPLPPVDATLINSGAWDMLRKYVEEIDRCLKTHGIKRVICYNPESLSVLLRLSKSKATFVSITRFYAEMLRKESYKKLKLPPVTYQDPCHLGRYAKEYRAPREVIAALGLNLMEMWRSCRDALCCGAGGGMLTYNTVLASVYASNRWQEASSTGAKVMITACPFCYTNLSRSKPQGIKVMDITTLVAQAYGCRL